MTRLTIQSLVALSLTLGVARAAVITEWAGSGENTAYVVINFADGANYAFGVLFDGSTTGLSLIQTLDAQTGLDVVYQDYGWGVFVDGLSYDGHSNSGYGGGENWWHYWNQADGQEWQSSWVGAGDRIVNNGDSDGWVYGRDTAPIVPEPATLGLLFLGGALLRRRMK